MVAGKPLRIAWTLFAAWVQDGSRKVLTSTSFDRSLSDHFLRDYLGTPPEISVTERPA